MESFKVNSKLFVPLSYRQLQIKKALLVILLAYTLYVFIELLLKGFNPGLMASLLIASLIVNLFFYRLKEGYQDKILHISVGNENVLLKYMDVKYDFAKIDLNLSIPLRSINQLEFSDQLNALRVVGPWTKNFKDQMIDKVDEWVIYIDPVTTYQILNIMEDKTCLEINYLDR